MLLLLLLLLLMLLLCRRGFLLFVPRRRTAPQHQQPLAAWQRRLLPRVLQPHRRHPLVLARAGVGCAPSSGPDGGGENQTYVRPAAVDVDYGHPVELCKEAEPGVFRRSWSKADVELDCNRSELVAQRPLPAGGPRLP